MKNLTRATVLHDIRLLAAGANGVAIESPVDSTAEMDSEAMDRFCATVTARWFTREHDVLSRPLSWWRIGGMGTTPPWGNLGTLADAILAERKRLDRVKKPTNGKG